LTAQPRKATHFGLKKPPPRLFEPRNILREFRLYTLSFYVMIAGFLGISFGLVEIS